MKKKSVLLIGLVLLMIVTASCAATQGGNGQPSPEKTPSPSGNPDWQEVSGTVKEVNQGLILIALNDNGGDFMLRISENTQWDAGVDKAFKTGNSVTCLVKPEPTFTTPSQGEVMRVLKNDPAK
ncbi:MAG: hypothetical protein ACYCX2_03130 [Christensenellales bacterium]